MAFVFLYLSLVLANYIIDNWMGHTSTRACKNNLETLCRSAFSLDMPTSKRAIWYKVEHLLDEARYIYKACCSLYNLLKRKFFDPTRVGCRAEKRDIPGTYHPNARQQNLVPGKEGRWCDAPRVFWRWDAFVADARLGLDDCKGFFFLLLHS